MLKITYKDYLRYQKLYGKVEENNKILEVKEDEIEKILNKIKNKEEVNIMTLGERIRRNEREEKMRIANKARKEGRLEKNLETIKKMLLLKLDENIIKEVTGVKDTELENVKRQLLEV